MTVKANTRAKKVFWSPVLMTSGRKVPQPEPQQHQINSHRPPQNIERLRTGGMRKAETYKSLQQHHNANKKQQAAAFRPEHPKKQQQPKNKAQIDINSTRKKEQQLAANLQSYKNLNRHIQQHNLQMSASNTLRGSAHKKQYPMKQYQFNSPTEYKSGTRFLQGQPGLETSVSARHSDKLYSRHMSKLAVKGQSSKRT